MPKPKADQTERPRAQRLLAYRGARAVIAVAVMHTQGAHAPSYYVIAEQLGLPRSVADLADKLWNDANGPEESTTESEEAALERCQLMIETELEA